MKLKMTTCELEIRAKKALTETLRRMSGVNLKDIQCASVGSSRLAGILVHIEVLGHSHTLICDVERDGEPAHVRAGLRDSVRSVAGVTENAIPVVIAPYFSPDAQKACEDAGAGFLDLEGNAHLSVGEVFIAERSVSSRAASRVTKLSDENGKTSFAPRCAVRRLKGSRYSSEPSGSSQHMEKLRPNAFRSEDQNRVPGVPPGKDLNQRGEL